MPYSVTVVLFVPHAFECQERGVQPLNARNHGPIAQLAGAANGTHFRTFTVDMWKSRNVLLSS
jgi:hypothetical protein